MRILITLLLATLFFTNANAQKKKGKYSAYLYSVNRSSLSHNTYLDTLKSAYEDEEIRIVWIYSPSQMEFVLRNLSSSTIKVLWDDAAFISMGNSSERVFHKGIKITDRASPQSPTSVYKETSISELVCPISYVDYDGDNIRWRYKSIITGVYTNKKEKYDENLIGKTFKVVLPIRVDDKTIEYTFSFRTTFIEKERENYYQ